VTPARGDADRTMAPMPPSLRAIAREVERFAGLSPNLDSLRPEWETYISDAERCVPGVRIEDEGEIVVLGELSPGCRACKDGTWDCVFLTMRCNLDCSFCCSPHDIPADYAGSAFGKTPAAITDAYAATQITGVSFSGGEPFLDPPRLLDWVGEFRARWPDAYYWVYSNGLLADEATLRRLGELGVDEIRFNAAASGYDQPTLIRNMAAAAAWVANVTVEIPAIPADAPRLLASLEAWCTVGVKYLNLHELMCEPGTNAAALPGRPVTTTDLHATAIDPASRRLTLEVMAKVAREALALSVNDCSLQSKLRQVRGRRRCLAPLTMAPWEMAVGDDVFETTCAFVDDAGYQFVHPDLAGQMRARNPEFNFVRLARTAPLSLADPGKWIAFEVI
jgi:pyruvate formate-lyase activating enzyme-like uncharacterized protein